MGNAIVSSLRSATASSMPSTSGTRTTGTYSQRISTPASCLPCSVSQQTYFAQIMRLTKFTFFQIYSPDPASGDASDYYYDYLGATFSYLIELRDEAVRKQHCLILNSFPNIVSHLFPGIRLRAPPQLHPPQRPGDLGRIQGPPRRGHPTVITYCPEKHFTSIPWINQE